MTYTSCRTNPKMMPLVGGGIEGISVTYRTQLLNEHKHCKHIIQLHSCKVQTKSPKIMGYMFLNKCVATLS